VKLVLGSGEFYDRKRSVLVRNALCFLLLECIGLTDISANRGIR